MEAPSPLIYKSMLNGVQNGRGGKGSIFVFASGNGGAVDDQCNFDGYTNSIFSITISAIDRKGLHPYYSEGCSANMVVTYSSGSGDNIVSLISTSCMYEEVLLTVLNFDTAYYGCWQGQMYRPSRRYICSCTYRSWYLRISAGSPTRAHMARLAAYVCANSYPRSVG